MIFIIFQAKRYKNKQNSSHTHNQSINNINLTILSFMIEKKVIIAGVDCTYIKTFVLVKTSYALISTILNTFYACNKRLWE